MALIAALIFANISLAVAGTTGQISGTVSDEKSAPLAAVLVSVAAPTGRYTATTDAKGFYSITGVVPDSYTIAFQLRGYEPASVAGISVFADQTQTVDIGMRKSLTTIGRVTSRSAGGAYQPNQTTDTYTVTAAQIETALGKKFAISESNLLVSLPGASFDSSGYPVIRGGRENEEAFQFEGINYTDPSTNQFINSLNLNGVNSAQLIPGAGDASIGNSGTGVINLIAKRGTKPSFGLFDFEALAYPFSHQFGTEYGFATPNGRISNYTSYIGRREGRVYGSPGSNATNLGVFNSTQFVSSNDFVNNLVYKFGKDLRQELQFFYQNQIVQFTLNNGGIQNLFFRSNDPFALATWRSQTNCGAPFCKSGLNTAQIQQILPLDPQQTSPLQQLNRASTGYQPNEAMKFQYTNSINSSTFLNVRYSQIHALTIFERPALGQNTTDLLQPQGGNRGGVSVDLTKQINDRNLMKIGAEYNFARNITDLTNFAGSLNTLAGFGFAGGGYEVADFLAPNDPACPLVNNRCGYLYQYFPGGPGRLPVRNPVREAGQQTFGAYIDDTYSFKKVRAQIGLRFDGANYQVNRTNTDNKAIFPRIWEPRIGISYAMGRNDSIRANWSRSVEFAVPNRFETHIDASSLRRFRGIPSYDARTGTAATNCQTTQTVACVDYADQLYWEFFNSAGAGVTPVRPETFTNVDFSYSHQFPHNVGLKITPFYRHGFDALAQVASVIGVNPLTGAVILSPAISTNLGQNRATGVEALITKEAQFGFSGSLAMTYLNEFSNVIPLSPSEDFFPSIPPASLALGNLYRVGFLSPFQATLSAQYKTRTGWKFNPIITYNKGYPLNTGLLAPVFINGVAYNVPKTNLTSPNGSTDTSQYVDPLNPGSRFNPNIVATRGVAESASPGGVLSNATFNTNISVEYSPPRSRTTVGLLVANVFNQLYGGPYGNANNRWQPVANGVAGPLTGYDANAVNFPGIGFRQYALANPKFGQLPYLNDPNNAPISFRLYLQIGF